jgi:hypothetical protein
MIEFVQHAAIARIVVARRALRPPDGDAFFHILSPWERLDRAQPFEPSEAEIWIDAGIAAGIAAIIAWINESERHAEPRDVFGRLVKFVLKVVQNRRGDRRHRRC